MKGWVTVFYAGSLTSYRLPIRKLNLESDLP